MNQRPSHEQQDTKDPFEVWHFYGKIPRADFEAANDGQDYQPDQAADPDGKPGRDAVDAVVTLVNDTVIRAVLNPLLSGRMPFHVFTWSRRAGHWAGIGVAEQVAIPQIMLNSATREMFNNAAKSSGAHVVMDEEAVEPAIPGDYRMGVGDKLWLLRKGSGVDDVRKVFASFEWPNTTPQLMTLIEFSLKMFEEASSIPLITQGQSGKTTPDTFSGQQLQDNNAMQLLRDVGFRLNDQITTPLVVQFYEWLLIDETIPDEEKGDYQVDASGALAIIEKALNDQRLPMLIEMSLNPAFGLNPRLCVEGAIRAWRMVPAQFQYTEAEREEMAKRPPPKDPAIEAAEIRAQSAEKIAQSHDQLLTVKTKADTDRDAEYVNSQARRDATMAQAKMEELALRERIANLEYQTKMIEFATRKQISLDQAKVELAKETMGIRAQMALAGADGEGPQVTEPPNEPQGRAPDGRAFQQ